jgi:hypothetical protein
MEWKQIDPADYNCNDTEPFYEINEIGQVRKIKNQKLIKLVELYRYNLKTRRVCKSTLLNKYFNAVNLTDYEPLKNYPNYLINRNGNLYSVQRNKLLKLQLNIYGYYELALSKNGKLTMCRIHRLVAEQFIPNPRNYPVVNHIDGNKQNNNVNNLEWCTYVYNAQTENTLRRPIQIKYNKYYRITYTIAGKRIAETFKTEQEAIDANENLKESMWNRQAKHYPVELYIYNNTHNGKQFYKSSKVLKTVVDYKYNLFLQIKCANKFKQLINLK